MLAASFLLAALVIRFQPLVEREIRSLGLSAYPLAIVIFAIVASAPFSVTDALAIMNGAIFGPVKGSLVSAIGLVLGALGGYWINRRASQMLDLDAYLERVPRWVKRFPVGSPAFLIAVRLIPGFGGTVATASAATFRVPVWVHVWTMCAVAVPLCTILAIFGDRVTVVVHRYEYRAHVYWEAHRPHLHLPHRVRVKPTP
ncbi:MAG TPA: VTT domain-containing protein [Candidatus Baltobacteraceae bacterium]|nr:VTT domain-containing protein [Candidatus Baltobacteraceae bacterium]